MNNAITHRRGVAAVALAAVFALASCGSGSDQETFASNDHTQVRPPLISTSVTPTTTPRTSPTSIPSSATTAAAAAGTTVAAETPPPSSAVAVEATTTNSMPPAQTSPAASPLVPGVAQIGLLQPPAGGAARTPLFEWQGIPGAAEYRLVVTGPAGPIWAWQGTASSVRLGGLGGERPVSFGGPQIAPGSSWSVVALDPAGAVIAVSELRSVEPA